jgi:hypothetical protein
MMGFLFLSTNLTTLSFALVKENADASTDANAPTANVTNIICFIRFIKTSILKEGAVFTCAFLLIINLFID